MVSISGIFCTSGLLLTLVVCSFTCVAVGRGVATGDEVIARVQGSGGADGAVGVEDGGSRIILDGAGYDESTRRSDHSEAKRVGGVTLVARNLLNDKVKAETTGMGSNDTEVDSGRNSTRGGSPPIAPPGGKPKSSTAEHSVPANVTLGSAPSAQDAGTGDEAKSSPAHGGTCTREHGPVIASLAANGGDGEDGEHAYTLSVENGGGKSELVVSIRTPKGVKASMETSDGSKADPVDMKLEKGKRETVTITVMDKEAAMGGARVNVSWGEGDCYVKVPAENVGDNVTQPSVLSLLSAQGTLALVVGGMLVLVVIVGVAGVWGCVSWRGRARRHGDAEAKYQELEMTLPETVSKEDDGMSPSGDGWDEVWEDDDWQDTEGVRSSSASVALSANGLNSRRANRDGWDSSWDD